VAANPARKNLFDTKVQSGILSVKDCELFYSIVAKLLYVAKQGCLDIQLAVAYLCTRVHDGSLLQCTQEYVRSVQGKREKKWEILRGQRFGEVTIRDEKRDKKSKNTRSSNSKVGRITSDIGVGLGSRGNVELCVRAFTGEDVKRCDLGCVSLTQQCTNESDTDKIIRVRHRKDYKGSNLAFR
jgi:hypothetical protein